MDQDEQQALAAFGALSHVSRLAIYKMLAARWPDQMMAGELAEVLGIGASTLSAHLSKLRQAGLIGVNRKGTSLFYFFNEVGTQKVSSYWADLAGAAIAAPIANRKPEVKAKRPPATAQAKPVPPSPKEAEATETTTPQAQTGRRTVLFLCTGNSARSILAESILNRLGSRDFVAFSAGSNPVGKIHPAASSLLGDYGYAVRNLSSKSWTEFAGTDAPALDMAITVCDDAADETCPVWPGGPIAAHWGLPDPAAVTGSKAQIAVAFEQTYEALEARISALLDLSMDEMDRAEMQLALNAIK
ncbi:MAG: ArsR family transcriptional regulator [Robiginitomaculum sp.]|nr:MAG: ArsR family transcriptional regulator [Robiginitomaculum sp.]